MKILSFQTSSTQTITSFQSETSEVISVNFRKKEVTKTVEINNQTGNIVSSFEVIDKPQAFMGEGFGEIVNLLLKKHA